MKAGSHSLCQPVIFILFLALHAKKAKCCVFAHITVEPTELFTPFCWKAPLRGPKFPFREGEGLWGTKVLYHSKRASNTRLLEYLRWWKNCRGSRFCLTLDLIAYFLPASTTCMTYMYPYISWTSWYSETVHLLPCPWLHLNLPHWSSSRKFLVNFS